MRQPTPNSVLYDFWMRSLNGEDPARTHEPQCGVYKTRLVRGGPWVPVAISMEQIVDEAGELCQPERLTASVGTKPHKDIDRLWLGCRPITTEEYDEMMRAHLGDMRMAATRAAVDLISKPVRVK